MPVPLLLVGFSLAIAVGAVRVEPLKIGTTDEQLPFGPLICRVLETVDYQSTVTTAPQARLFADISSGLLDATFFITNSASRQLPGLVKIPVVLYQDETVALTIRKDIKISALSDLANYEVGTVRGSKVREDLLRGLTAVTSISNEVQQYKMLLAGRIDVAVTQRALVEPLAKAAGLTSWYVQEPPLDSTPLFLGVTKNLSSRAVAKITKAFGQAVANRKWKKDFEQILMDMAH